MSDVERTRLRFALKLSRVRLLGAENHRIVVLHANGTRLSDLTGTTVAIILKDAFRSRETTRRLISSAARRFAMLGLTYVFLRRND
jgi:putative Ca2+/H+ antiporter (TMEM165/GDT1 family)